MKKPFKPEAAVRRDIQKLQRAVVDALEDVKAINIRVFDTEQLSPLFERVIVASGNTNRQTRALAASVRDRVREAGFGKPGIEGEENGEWIIVDCGTVVAHIMQPAIRDYYRLEEIWGETPVRLRLGAPAPVVRKMAVKKSAAGDTEKPASRARKTPAKKTSATSTTTPAGKTAARHTAKPALKKATAKPSAKRPAVAKKASAQSVPKATAKTATRKTAAAKTPRRAG